MRSILISTIILAVNIMGKAQDYKDKLNIVG